MQDSTPTKGVDEINTYSLPQAVSETGLNGVLMGLVFNIQLEGKMFEVTQAEDYHIIYLIPNDASSQEDWELVFDYNPYDGQWSMLGEHLDETNTKLLESLWLYEIDNSYNYMPFVGHVVA
jgi:hypothetical protein